MKHLDRTRRTRSAVMITALLGSVLMACGSDASDAGDVAATAATTPTTAESTQTTVEASESTVEATESTDSESTAAPVAEETPITEFEFGAGDYYFDTKGVTELPAGTIRTTMTVDEASTEAHVAMFAEVKEGETVEGVLEAAKTDFTGYAAAQMVNFTGGVNALTAGESQSSLVTLTPGTYVLACFIPAQDGSFPPQPHSALGMWSTIEVVEPEQEPAAVEAEGTIVMGEMMFTLPDDFDGNGTFAVENQGALLHEMGIVRLDEGKTGADVAAFYDFSKGPPDVGNEPDTPSGGFAANHPGRNGWVELDLDPGNYVLVCFVGNAPPSFSTHLNQGMWKEFSVT